MRYERELQVALDAATLAADVVLAGYQDFEATPDAPAGLGTQADRDSQGGELAAGPSSASSSGRTNTQPVARRRSGRRRRGDARGPSSGEVGCGSEGVD
jgi:hypothetical protein